MDFSSCQLGLKSVGHQEVVDTPPRVLFACLEAIRPPRIDIGLVGIEKAERIGKSVTEQTAEFFAFLVGKSGIPAISLGVFQVNFLSFFR